MNQGELKKAIEKILHIHRHGEVISNPNRAILKFPTDDKSVDLILALFPPQPTGTEEEIARETAHSIQPCDFGSTEAIKVFASALHSYGERVREECAMIAENGRFLHDEAPDAKFGKACAKAIRRSGKKEKP